eukprot:5476769-Prorocentrum_lima.AAC.1
MTSSLVGSEMCIRDRLLPLQQRLQSALGLFSARNQKLLSCMFHATRTPVSYTHLTLPTICSV